MKQRMKESYRKGIANHPGPEPCEGGREAALEALDRGTCRLCIELRNRAFSGGRRCHATRKATSPVRRASGGRSKDRPHDPEMVEGGRDGGGSVVRDGGRDSGVP